MTMSDLISKQAVIDMLNFDAELLRRALDNMDIVGITRRLYERDLKLIESYIREVEMLSSIVIPASYNFDDWR